MGGGQSRPIAEPGQAPQTQQRRRRISVTASGAPAAADRIGDSDDWETFSAADSGAHDELTSNSFIYSLAASGTTAYSEQLKPGVQLVRQGLDLLKTDHQLNDALVKLRAAASLFEEVHTKELAQGGAAAKEAGDALSGTLACIGDVLDRAGKTREAEGSYARALKLKEQINGAGHVSTAPILNSTGDLLQRQKRWKEAMLHYERALDAWGPTNPDRVRTLNSQAIMHERKGELQEALQLHQTTLEIKEKEIGKDSKVLVSTLNGLGEVCRRQGLWKQAIEHYERSLAIEKAADKSARAPVAALLNSLGLVLEQRGRLDDAMTRFAEAMSIHDAMANGTLETVENARTLKNMSVVLEKQGRMDAAMWRLQRALAIETKLFGNSHTVVAQTQNNLGVLRLKQGMLSDALERFKEAAAIFEDAPMSRVSATMPTRLSDLRRRTTSPANAHPALSSAYNNLGLVLQKQGRLKEALAKFKEALAIKEAAHGDNHPATASTLANIGLVLVLQGKAEAALEPLERAVATEERAVGPTHPMVARKLALLGDALGQVGRVEEALPHVERALAIYQEAHGKDSTEVGITLANLGDLLMRQPGSAQKAAEMFGRAQPVFAARYGRDYPHAAYVQQRLEMARASAAASR